MTATRLFVTTNGPGEVMGWVRPFLRRIFARDPTSKVTVVLLPCAYASGHETQALEKMFPSAAVIGPDAYARFLIGRQTAGMQRGNGVLQYLGGDLFHAITIARRLELEPMTYKFTKRSYANRFQRFFALDERNAQQLRNEGAPPDKVRVVGNLVYDAVAESLQRPPPPPGEGSGVCILPGSRPYELKFLLPFFLSIARELVRLRPDVPVSFVVSPFSSDDELRAGIEHAGDPHLFGTAGRFDAARDVIHVDGCQFSIDRSMDYRSMAQSQLVISIPGTKCIEAAVLGRALLVTVPTNRLDELAMNGVAAYLHRIPLIGRPLKTSIARALERRLKFIAQPNIDAGELVAPELRGILKPAEVAAHAAAMLDDAAALRLMGERLKALYASNAGAADRMAAEALSVAARSAAQKLAV
ncbi:MAG: hypothetical protein ACR2KS_01485 [Candidatus Eremiobacter antarcticus]|nr:hypothetical protein [Candidatus Eremiobacteraeota bacterium]MBC5808223.1 hypothetical protein [Candidatus Eremiobacteraeota bacterium]